jgi:DNA primase large subunit
MNFLKQVKKEDDMLYEVSQKFTDLTQECKNILDKIKEKSEARKA